MTAAAARQKKQAEKNKFLIVDSAQSDNDRFPTAVFGCETLAEAIRICEKMNADAGRAKFVVRAS
jgi:hypothetical protein